MASTESIAEQREILASLFPYGSMWPRDLDSNFMKFVEALAVDFAEVEALAYLLLQEANPNTAIYTLSEWEAALGLPDDCAKNATTIQERVIAIIDKLLNTGGQSIPYFKQLAIDYGYDVEIEEFRPFRCGISSVSDGLYDLANKIRHQWRMTVDGDRLTRFKCGQSEVIDPLFKLTRAEDLECVMQKRKPAQTTLIFKYNEAN